MLPVSLDCQFFITLRYSLTFTICILCLVYSMLPVYLDCLIFFAPSVFSYIYHICPVSAVPYVASFSGLSICFIAPSIFSNMYLSCDLCTLCCQFLWIVHSYCPSIFSNIYLSCVLCTLCYQFLWIVLFWLPLWYSLTFICPVSCVPYVTSFSGLSISAPLVFSNVYLSCVLCTLCFQFLWIVHCFYCPSIFSNICFIFYTNSVRYLSICLTYNCEK